MKGSPRQPWHPGCDAKDRKRRNGKRSIVHEEDAGAEKLQRGKRILGEGDCRCHQRTSRMSVLTAVCLNERQWVLVMGKLGSLMRNAKVIEFI